MEQVQCKSSLVKKAVPITLKGDIPPGGGTDEQTNRRTDEPTIGTENR